MENCFIFFYISHRSLPLLHINIKQITLFVVFNLYIKTHQNHVLSNILLNKKVKIENLNTFTLGGDSHVNALGYYFSVNNPGNGSRGLPFTYDRFYGLGIGGISFSQWILSIIEGNPLGSLACIDCSAPDAQELGRYPLPIEAP
ncbi:MAG: hypothetical protein EBY41_03240 [Proteobacteria bacterium]|nr:hypothetical protein [Pseudomonadota bacterium]